MAMTEEKVEYTTGGLKPHHYSSRLRRNFKDGDLLTRLEAAQVISENSGREVNPRYLAKMTEEGRLHPEKLSPRIWLYTYAEVKRHYVEAHVGRHQQDQPTENALRQRDFKARRRQVAE